MQKGLKGCPFCGSNEIHIIDRVGYSDILKTYYHIRCKECGVTTDEYGSQFEAIMAWNRRVEENNV